MNPCPVGQVLAVRLDELGDHFRRYRLRVPQAVQAMAQSLRRWGQCAPIVATLRQERPQVLDGFTRWEAAHQVRGMTGSDAKESVPLSGIPLRPPAC